MLLSKSFVRPADANVYTSGDLVADTTVSGAAVTPLLFTPAKADKSFDLLIRRARIKKTSVSIANASFRLHLYKTIPVPANADNGVFSTSKAADYVGSFDCATAQAFTDGAVVIGTPTIGSEVAISLAAGQRLYGLLEARGAYIPAISETITVELEAILG
jgi:hypothetical protein